ncbi:hypothetical protein MMC18_003654 [Xylographa bjoerkii]|nr:hypothetical protein [Xylographa bjoerkii]
MPAKRNAGLLARRRQQKWISAVVLAVVRFEAWWSKIDLLLRNYGNAESSVRQLTLDTLPPLDVLMVWHGYMLNPKPYHPTESSSQHESIDCSSRNYTLSTTAASVYQTATGFTADLLDHLKSLEPITDARLNTLTTNCHLTVPPQAVEALRQHWSLPSRAVHPSSIELISATLRQGRFVDTMSHYLWIRSPSLAATLSRARARYVQYLSLLASHPGKPMIPTIDIDLVWHTHQLSPSAYYDFSIRAAGGRFINHSDTIDNTVRKDGLGVVRDLWWRTWGEEYARCFCWDCGLLLSLTEQAQRPEGTGAPTGLEARAVVEARAKTVEEAAGFYRAVEQARRKGVVLPAMEVGAFAHVEV